MFSILKLDTINYEKNDQGKKYHSHDLVIEK